MNILIVSASQRSNSKSLEVSKYVKTNILNNDKEYTSTILDLSLYPFLLDNYGIERNDEELLVKNKDLILTELYKSDAIIFIVPEWGGMIPPALVNLFLLSANGSANGLPMGHKPAFVTGISASDGGVYPISLLKGYTAKNTHITWVPLHAVIKNVDLFLDHDWSPESSNRYSQIQSRLLVGIKSLIIYAHKLKDVRKELVELSTLHPFGQ